MRGLKEFFGIEGRFRFEWGDLTALLTLLNVGCLISWFWWAPLIGLANCLLSLALFALNKGTHVNLWVMQGALIVLNIFFLM